MHNSTATTSSPSRPGCGSTCVRMVLRGLVLIGLLVVTVRVGLHFAEESPTVVKALTSSQLEVFHDEKFHLKLNQTNQDVFFEGWYYKLIGPYTDDIIVVIPGLFVNKVNQSSSEAFITVVQNTQVNYYRFPVDSFRSVVQPSGFTVTIGDCTFTEKGMTLSIMPDEDDDAETNAVMGEITFDDIVPWPQRILHPSTMGVMGYFGDLECYHHVLSLHHKLHGYISVGEALTDLEMGTGYLEKDWGSNFPATWIWAQSNHFALLKPPKRGKGANSVEGEVWAESEENVEETFDEGPGAGDSSGAVSALYADHIHNHEQPVSLFLSIARVPLPFPSWLLSALGFAADNDRSMPGFVVGFLYEKKVNIFSSYQFDTLAKFEVEIVEKDDDKEIVHLLFVDAGHTKSLQVDIHKPQQINAEGKRKKDTACLKKAISQKNRERERLGGHLNPLEEAFLMADLQKPTVDGEKPKSAEEEAAIKAAMEAGIAAEKANTPEAKLAQLYEKPVPKPAPIVASMYGPSKEGKMAKYVKESLIGGRIEIRWNELLSSQDYVRMTAKERKVKDWKQEIVGSEIMYSNQLYRAIGKPAAMELMGEIEWLIEETERRNHDWQKGWVEWLIVPKNGIWLSVAAMIVLVFAAFFSSCTKPKAKEEKKIKSQ